MFHHPFNVLFDIRDAALKCHQNAKRVYNCEQRSDDDGKDKSGCCELSHANHPFFSIVPMGVGDYLNVLPFLGCLWSYGFGFELFGSGCFWFGGDWWFCVRFAWVTPRFRLEVGRRFWHLIEGAARCLCFLPFCFPPSLFSI